MQNKKRILLKLTGEIFLDTDTKKLTPTYVKAVIEQIKQLADTHLFGIVVGGGNFFRGKDQGTALGMTPAVGHQTGLLATMMNGLILKDLLEQRDLPTELFCALTCPEIGEAISHQSILQALEQERILVFTGGTGNPFFTNDTNAIIRGLQIDADEIWKASNVDGVYTADPKEFPDAQLLKQVGFKQAYDEKLGIMDPTAFALAEQYNQPIRVFNVFEKDALLKATLDPNFGTLIYD